MSDADNKLAAAINERNASQVRSLVLAREFVMISISGENDDEDNVGALTAEMGDFDVLVVFTSEQNAGVFVREMGELFENEEEVDGVVVEGNAMLEYLPEGFGILLNPEIESACVIEPALAAEILETGE